LDSTTAGYNNMDWVSILLTMFRLVANSIQSPTPDGYRNISLTVTMPEREADYSPPHSPKVKLQRALPRVVQYAFVYW
jgi:hypothetical protein